MATIDIEVIEKIDETIKVRVPGMYRVIIHNDNTTTIDFVIHVLTSIFHKTTTEAMVLAQTVHETGQGIAGSPYTKEVAEEKVHETVGTARANSFPLIATFEEL